MRRCPFLTAMCACACLCVASGCSVSQPFPDRAMYALEPGKPEKSMSVSALTLRVMPLRIAKPYDAQLFNYKIGPSQFTQDYYAGFIAPPDRLLGASLLDWLNDSGAVQYAVAAGSSLDCAANLESQVTAMYADHTDNAAVLEMRVFVISEAAGVVLPRVLFQKTYSEKEPLPGRDSAAFVKALSAAWRRMLGNVANDLRTVNVGPPPTSQPAER